ncbi:MAG: molybdenum cofactor guanylyltransferase MobA [Sulfurimonas sp.]|jgi:molybdopterin-guanine dinucleotide biosynthesis protein A|nr:molybdenum cofactor guanylyltransferase MobA [Sulfurimonadaceae bacterium]
MVIDDLPCVIFAGGRSSRMVEDKSLLPFANFPTLTEFQLKKYQKIFKNVYISTKDSSKFSFDAEFIEDIKSDIFAPSVAFLSIFKTLKCERFFAISVDTPFVKTQTIKKLIELDSSSKFATIVKSAYALEPLCGIYHKSLVERFEDMLKTNNHKLNHMLKSVDIKTLEVFDEDEFLNLNHPHEYQKALTLLNL